MWISDKTLSLLAKALKIEVFQLFVHYQADKSDASSSSVLFELRSKIMGDIKKTNAHIDARFNDALKNS